MPMIVLPHGNAQFDSDDLKAHIRATGRPYIIQGQTACVRHEHPKPNSLDCWLRDNYATNPNTKQAVNQVIAELILTGDFEEGQYTCPDSGKLCKGIRLIDV